MSVQTETHAFAADLVTIQQQQPERYPYLLESVAHGQQQSRYSILFAFPEQTIQCNATTNASDFLKELDQTWAHHSHAGISSPLPFTGGWFVYLGYELVKGIEPILECPDFPYDYPVAFATRCPAALIVDHSTSQTICLVEDDHAALMSALLRDLKSKIESKKETLTITTHEDNPSDYKQGVKAILEYIKAGDVFQVNLSRAWRAQLDSQIDSSTVYRSLKKTNPAPFACLVQHPQGDIISSSPERLVRVHKGQVETRPIAGTRPRSRGEQDQHWLDELRTDHKEQAEHIMLIDLERNDLGRVCVPGTIEVDELMALESYEHVHHIVSNIKGKLRDNVTPVDVIKAVFPGGTITGCPKVRCMEIIAELEKEGRGPYTGSVGYINYDGSMDFNILIRTLFRQNQEISFRAGAGIVADSIAENELNETRHKARGLLLALEQD